MFDELPEGTPILTVLRTALRTAFAQLPPDKRRMEEVRMNLARTVPEIGAAVRDGLSVGAVAEQVAASTGRDAGDPEVLLFAAVVTGARLAAHETVERDPGSSYIDALDTALGLLEDGVPLADARLGPAPRARPFHHDDRPAPDADPDRASSRRR